MNRILVILVLGLLPTGCACRCCPTPTSTVEPVIDAPTPAVTEPEASQIVITLSAEGMAGLGDGAFNLGIKDFHGRAHEVRLMTEALRTAVGGDDGRLREPDGSSTASVLVSADRGAKWHHVQAIMEACSAEGIRIYKMQFGVRDNDE